MHLGRFHKVVDELDSQYRNADVPADLENAAAQLEQYAATKNVIHLEQFRAHLKGAMDGGDIVNASLQQPYAQEVIDELGLRVTLNPALSKGINEAISNAAFDSHAVANELRMFATNLRSLSGKVQSINTAFTDMEVEYQDLEQGSSEIGFLLPKQAVGVKLSDLSDEFSQLNRLARAIREITGGDDYDPTVRTISSSWWQIFLDIDAKEVAAWTFAIERIVALYKSNLEIKLLTRQLKEKNLPEEAVEPLNNAVDSQVRIGIEKIAHEMREMKQALADSKASDEGRDNELETQLRQGLLHLSKRLHEGAKIEINVSLPARPKDPQKEGLEVSPEALEQYRGLFEEWEKLRNLRNEARIVSQATAEPEWVELLAIENRDPGAGNTSDLAS